MVAAAHTVERISEPKPRLLRPLPISHTVERLLQRRAELATQLEMVESALRRAIERAKIIDPGFEAGAVTTVKLDPLRAPVRQMLRDATRGTWITVPGIRAVTGLANSRFAAVLHYMVARGELLRRGSLRRYEYALKGTVSQ